MVSSSDRDFPASRIQPDDVLIKRPVVQEIMGNISVSSVYADPDLMRLRVYVTPTVKSPHAVNWIEREVYELRAHRVAQSDARAAAAPARIGKRRERRRIKREAASASTASDT